MSNRVRRIFVEKKPGFDVEAQSLSNELRHNLGIKGLQAVRVVNRYDVAGITEEEYQRSRNTIFAEPNLDDVYDEEISIAPLEQVFAMEYLPGQYDQRADSAAQCVQILTQKERPQVATSKVIILKGVISDEELARIKSYCINPVEAREAALDKPSTLDMRVDVPADVLILEGFIARNPSDLSHLHQELGLAMSQEDLAFCQAYFRDKEHRDPTFTEIKVIDTYWSDHCRHTTFLTEVKDIQIADGRYGKPIQAAYNEYLAARKEVYGDRPKELCLMDIALMGMKELRKKGLLEDLEESEEINAASVVVNVDVNGQNEEWLLMFKNETHNHPTEIEPFGGAATCLGGAIRDPLSGRAFVYQAMRVTGSGDPRTPIEKTLPGKLPQRKITIAAATGYSSYGNQIGLATGQVAEVYDEGFVAKRMEVGAVIGAVPRRNVVREAPSPGDVILLVGGRTGRDGCGGATGSSKEHTEESLSTCGAEVQKGDAPTEHKILRLFRRPEASRLIKKCNDFGAGGVSVAIGELSDGLNINLDAIPKKYEGLDGTELAISESQERMAVVVAAADVQAFSELAHVENLEVTPVAEVTAEERLKMVWRGKPIVNISREFLNTNGVRQTATVSVQPPDEENSYFAAATRPQDVKGLRETWLNNLQDLNVAGQRGLVERFDNSVGAATVLMPHGGKYQATPSEGMVAKLPVLEGETTTASVMTYGFNPKIGKWSPYHGALYAIVEAVTKAVALGGDYRKVRLTLQEYFEKLGQDPVRWGKPFSALLGALHAQKKLGIPAIGGKDSMSGTFMDLHVPPSLIAFAVTTMDVRQVVSQEFKKAGSRIVLIPVLRDEKEEPDFTVLTQNYAKVRELIAGGKVLASGTIRVGGLAATLSRMSFGNRIGVDLDANLATPDLFAPNYGSIVLEVDAALDLSAAFGDTKYQELGYTQEQPVIRVGGAEITIDEAFAAWETPLGGIFPTRKQEAETGKPREIRQETRSSKRPSVAIARPRVLVTAFPGTNSEYDSARAFRDAGAIAETLVIRNLTVSDVEESIEALVQEIKRSQIVMIPGGFSAGDEPDGSAKFIATMFRNPRVKEAVTELLDQRDGLMLGICNGFQALIKLGLVPYGRILDEMTPECPTLTYNTVGRHIATMVRTKVVSTLSPWFSNLTVGDIHTIPISHGEGRFVAPPEEIERMLKNGQIATQYVDFAGNPSYDLRFNPNGSTEAVEAITSPDGRVLGKMGHSERVGSYIAVNVPGEKEQRLFAAGVNYFK